MGPSEFPSTETRKVTGWEDETIDFSLEPLRNTVSTWYLDSPHWHVKIHLSFLEKDLATGRASNRVFFPSLFFSFSILCLKWFAVQWHELGSGKNNLGKCQGLIIYLFWPQALSSRFGYLLLLPRKSPSVLGSALLVACSSWPVSDLGRQLNEVRGQDTWTSWGEMFPTDFLQGGFWKVSPFVLFSIFCQLHWALIPWWQRSYLLVWLLHFPYGT